MMNCGIIVTWNGTISVAISTANSAVRPRNRNRANAYPASVHSTRLHSTVVTATIALLSEEAAERRAGQGVGVVGRTASTVRDEHRREVQRLARGLQRRDEQPGERERAARTWPGSAPGATG